MAVEGSGDATSPAAPSSGNNASRGRGRGRGPAGRSGRGGRGGTATPTIIKSSFKGNTKDMNGHVFQVHHETVDLQQFDKTVEALSEYAMKSLKKSGDLISFFKDLQPPVLAPVADIVAPTTIVAGVETALPISALAQRIWNNEVDDYCDRVRLITQNLKTLYSVAWGQCSEAMKAKLQTHDEFTTKDLDADCSWLLKEIKAVTFRFEGQRFIFLSLDDAHSSLCAYRQQADEPILTYLHNFKNKVDVLEHYGGSYGVDPGLLKAAALLPGCPPAPTPGQPHSPAYMRFTRNRSLGIAFIKRADPKRFSQMLADLENNFSRGLDQYPADLTSAYTMLNVYVKPVALPSDNRSRHAGSGGAAVGASGTAATTPSVPPAAGELGLTFAQAAATVVGANGVTHAGITCYRCNAHGHYADQCPADTSSVQLLQVSPPPPASGGGAPPEHAHSTHFTFAQHFLEPIPSSWVLLDSESTVSVFNNPALLRNIRPSDTHVTVHTNGGTQVSTLIGDIPNFGTVWFNPASIANILSLAAVRKVCRITMDTAVAAAFHVHKVDGSLMTFNEYHSGLYYHDTSPSPNHSSAIVTDYTLVNTVAQNKTMFTRREIEGADKARDLYRKVGYPAEKFFQSMLTKNLIHNCPITAEDAKRALLIYGPDPATLKGKTTRRTTEHIPRIILSTLPDYILDLHRQVTLCMDVFFVQGQRFHHTISRNIKFRTVSPIINSTKATLQDNTLAVVNTYRHRGFEVTNIHADGAFECIRQAVAPVILNINAADEHVGEVERSIRTIKERVRATVHGLPYKRWPREMIKGVVGFAVKSLNQFPAEDGISDVNSPTTIVTGLPPPDYNHIQLNFGEYVTIFEDNNPTNTNSPRAVDAIALHLTGNAQGNYFFMSLATGERVSRRQYTKLPLSQRIVDAVEALAATQNQPLLPDGGPVFAWNANEPLVDVEEDDNGADQDINDGDQGGDVPPPADAFHEAIPLDEIALVDPLDQQFLIADAHHEDEDIDDQEILDDPEDEPPVVVLPDNEDDISVNDQNNSVTEDEDTVGTGLDSRSETSGYNLRANRGRNYDHRYDARDMQFLQATIGKWNSHGTEAKEAVFGYTMNQMTATAGIKKHGQAAVDAIFKEFAQLDDKSVFEPVDAATLNRAQKKAALRSVNLIKEKRSGELKGRSCADGSSQRNLYTKEETASPTISTDALMLTLSIDAHENRDVATADVVGAYLHASMPDYVLVKLVGDAVAIMVSVNPGYAIFVVMEGGKPTLYLRLLKALYGCVQSALLWYNLFTSKLKERGFILNPYDPCVANCLIKGKQCTVGWYVDDTKISHEDPAVVTEIVEAIEANFGKMTVTRGKNHTFLGMDISFNGNGTVTIAMASYIKDAIADFGEDVSSPASTPAGKSLFTVDESSPPLASADADLFHSIVAKLLYISSRARSDISPTIAFLCTRVAKSTEQDWAKLRRLLRYLASTIELTATIGADGLTNMHTWVDAAYAVHHDMRSHTGGCVSLGRGVLMPKSTKQKLTTKSSTEAELVGASDYLPNTIWAKNFLGAQGYDITDNVFYQDNQSAIRLETNGRASAGQKSRHINIRYFFIKDRIASDSMKIVHCPTAIMLADFYTKPLQGALFKRFRSVILGHEPISSLHQSIDTSNLSDEERVEDSRPVESERVGDPTKESDKEWSLVTRYRRKEPRDTESVVDHRMVESEVARAEEKQVKSTRRKYEEKKRVRFTPSSYFENNPIVVKI